MNELLFSYGTLQKEAVQLETFGRKLSGRADAIVGYRKTFIEITDEKVLALSGEKFHPIVTFSGNRNDEVDGFVFEVTGEELEKADTYEVADYQRVLADLRSGKKAWVYIEKREIPRLNKS